MSLACFVFDISEGGGGYPPPVGTKMARTPVGARVKVVTVHSTRLDKRNTMLANECRAFTELRVITKKNVFVKTAISIFLFPIGLNVNHNMRTFCKIALKELSIELLRGTVALLVPE